MTNFEELNKKYPLKYIKFNNKNWEYLTRGSGKITLLVFPGGGQYAQSQYQMIDEFSDKYKVIIPNIYNVYSIEEFCQEIDEILKLEKADKLIVYGLSIGALLAQSYTKRHKKTVLSLIISHGCAPTSPTYQKKIIRYLKLLNIILPITPSFMIKFIAKNWAGRIQGISKKVTKDFNRSVMENNESNNLMKLLSRKFYEKYLTKTLLYTWIGLHFDFHNNEKFNSETFKDWKGNVLILRTDNDPLMQDDGEFKKIYPNAKVYTFSGFGHLTAIYEHKKAIRVMKAFLNY